MGSSQRLFPGKADEAAKSQWHISTSSVCSRVSGGLMDEGQCLGYSCKQGRAAVAPCLPERS